MKYRSKCGHLPPHLYQERVAWCKQTFGPMSHDRWWAKAIIEIRFQFEDDYMMFILRWV